MEIIKYILLFFQGLFVFINIFGLPGNLLSLLIPLTFVFLKYLPLNIFWMILAIIIVGEIIEFCIGYFAGKFVGIDSKSFWSSIIGGIVLGIMMAPLFLGIGALIGVFLGAFLGTFIYEYLTTNDVKLSLKRGFYSFFSRMTGTIIKIFAGVLAILITIQHLTL